MSEGLEIRYKVVLSFNERDARADLQITNLRHADIDGLRRKIDALERLLLVEQEETPGPGDQP